MCFWGLNFFILLWFCRIPGTVCWRKLQRDTTHQLDMLKLRQSQTSAPLRYQLLLQKALLPSIKIPQSRNQVLDFGLTAIHVVSAELHHAGNGSATAACTAHGAPLRSALQWCSRLQLGLQRRLMCCSQMAADGSHITGRRPRETWQRLWFWASTSFFWVFNVILTMSLFILIISVYLSINITINFWKDGRHGNLEF